MIIDQSEIDALLAEADGLVAEAEAEEPPPPEPVEPEVPQRRIQFTGNPEVRRLLRLKVPVIAVLAGRMMTIADVRELAVGSIIEFEKSVEDELALHINNQPIGRGTCVKVGEFFGLRVTHVCDRAERIRSLGAED